MLHHPFSKCRFGFLQSIEHLYHYMEVYIIISYTLCNTCYQLSCRKKSALIECEDSIKHFFFLKHLFEQQHHCYKGIGLWIHFLGAFMFVSASFVKQKAILCSLFLYFYLKILSVVEKNILHIFFVLGFCDCEKMKQIK